MGNRHCEVREPGGLLGEVWRGPGCSFQEAGSVSNPERAPPKPAFTLPACSLGHGAPRAPEQAALLRPLRKT